MCCRTAAQEVLMAVMNPGFSNFNSALTSMTATLVQFKLRKSKARSAVKQQRQAGDPESTIHEACPLSVHKNGGAR
jgi:hypothetical protein